MVSTPLKSDKKKYLPAWWLKNNHAQTVWSTLFRPPTILQEEWERVELPDGDFIDLVWDKETADNEALPIVVLFHGLGGGINSPYIKGLMKKLSQNQWRPVLMHYRGCSGISNRLPKGYHSGATADMKYIVEHLKKGRPSLPFAAIGVSLGANALLKWLGESPNAQPFAAAAAVSVPFNLDIVASTLMQGFPRVYQWSLLKGLKKGLHHKFKKIACPFDLKALKSITNFWQFDNLITAPLHGFKDANDYYKRSSCRQFLKKISAPTLIIHAKDDPFMTKEAIPASQELSQAIQFELTENGGHVGFISGKTPYSPLYWLEERIPDFLTPFLPSNKGC